MRDVKCVGVGCACYVSCVCVCVYAGVCVYVCVCVCVCVQKCELRTTNPPPAPAPSHSLTPLFARSLTLTESTPFLSHNEYQERVSELCEELENSLPKPLFEEESDEAMFIEEEIE